MASLVDKVDAIVREKHLLKHPFYQAWNMGTLPLDTLRGYVKQYFHHIKREGQYVSAAHSNCPEIADRQVLIENLKEEECGPDNHPELWLRFGESLGLTREEIMAHAAPFEQTRRLFETFRTLTRDETFALNATALYCYESQVPEVASKKIEGLAKWYGISDERGTQFFSAHLTADEWHRQVGREMIAKYGVSHEEAVLEAARQATSALWGFLDGIVEHYPIEVC